MHLSSHMTKIKNCILKNHMIQVFELSFDFSIGNVDFPLFLKNINTKNGYGKQPVKF